VSTGVCIAHSAKSLNDISSDLLSRHELNQLLDEEMDEKERGELKAAEDICRRFLAWQLDERDGKSTKDKLAEILGTELD
jgi:DNA mismatch repair protein MSH5